MEIQYLRIKATLERCSREDLVTASGNFIENKVFFLKDYNSREFNKTYRILNVNSMFKDELQLAIEKYQMNEVNFLLQNNLIYKISQVNHQLDYHFLLYIKTAIEFDLFESPKHLKINTLYYNQHPDGKHDLVPNFITEQDIPSDFFERMQRGKIWVPTKKQHFEPYKIQKAS